MPGVSRQQLESRFNLPNPQEIWSKMKSGSTFRPKKGGGFAEYDIFGQEVGGPAPANGGTSGVTSQNQNGGSTSNVAAEKLAASEEQNKSYGGVSGGYGSGDPPVAVQNAVEPDGGPTGTGGQGGPAPVERKAITFGGGDTGTGRAGMRNKRFQNMTIPAEALKNVPDTDLAKIYAAAEKGFGAFRDFMQQNRNAPWFNDIYSAAKQAWGQAPGPMAKGALSRAGGGGGWGGPGNTGIAWMDRRYNENTAPKYDWRVPDWRGMGGPVGNPYVTDMGDGGGPGGNPALWPTNGPMMTDVFIDQNQDGIDDRVQQLQQHPDGNWSMNYIGVPGMGGPTNYQPGRPQQGGLQQNPYGIPPGSQWDTPENRRLMEIRKQQEAGGMMTGWYPPWLVDQQQGGPQQNPPFDPRILQMLMGGR